MENTEIMEKNTKTLTINTGNLLGACLGLAAAYGIHAIGKYKGYKQGYKYGFGRGWEGSKEFYTSQKEVDHRYKQYHEIDD